MPPFDDRKHLSIRLDVQTQREWQRLAAAYCAQKYEYLEAAWHWHAAGEYTRAATLLIEHYRTMVEAGQVQALYTLQAQFHKATLDETTWAQLKIATGRAAFLADHLEQAAALLGEALGAKDSYLKGQALYYRAKVFSNLRFEEALMHYNRGIELIKARSREEKFAALLVDLYIGKAWLFIQESEELATALHSLQAAEAGILADDFTRRCDLHNAWARLCSKQQNTPGELEHRQQAWMAAVETQDKELIFKTAHNLGQGYLWAGRYPLALDYLQQARAVAMEIGHRQWEGKSAETLGVWHFFQKQYTEAIAHYQLAYAAYQTTHNANWLGWICFDLAEVYAVLGDVTEGRRYFAEAKRAAQRSKGQPT